MYKQATIAVLIAVTFIVAAAMPATADHRDNEATYVLGQGLVVVSDDLEGTGLPGMSIGGGFDLNNPSAPDMPSVSVTDDVHGDLPEDRTDLPDGSSITSPLSYSIQCEEAGGVENAHCDVFVGLGGTTGTIVLS